MSRKKDPENWSPLAKAFYALDNETIGDTGYTERQRVKIMIRQLCQISETRFYGWIDAPDKIAQNHRYFIAVAFNKDLHELFTNT